MPINFGVRLQEHSTRQCVRQLVLKLNNQCQFRSPAIINRSSPSKQLKRGIEFGKQGEQAIFFHRLKLTLGFFYKRMSVTFAFAVSQPNVKKDSKFQTNILKPRPTNNWFVDCVIILNLKKHWITCCYTCWLLMHDNAMHSDSLMHDWKNL